MLDAQTIKLLKAVYLVGYDEGSEDVARDADYGLHPSDDVWCVCDEAQEGEPLCDNCYPELTCTGKRLGPCTCTARRCMVHRCMETLKKLSEPSTITADDIRQLLDFGDTHAI